MYPRNELIVIVSHSSASISEMKIKEDDTQDN